MLLAVLDVGDFIIIGLLILLFAAGRQVAATKLWPTERVRLARLEEKLDLLLTHAGLDYTPPPKAQWQGLADEGPARKISAIKAYREETGSGLAEAKRAVEEYIEGRRP
jgi:hypothetical protein